ncbi:hypothetical protein [Adhaeribacter soli]|uniref:Uncharacterized protein n=1 Tax=Adhaeribacter soli TaxID=2607655 RepID=A0A5N1IQZ4_9BACT|nr:hypothetical protein [Adhaeribacter soli]KAA9327366.1 hypothetical protein F0P94_15740 [Adhaeribacter soli]
MQKYLFFALIILTLGCKKEQDEIKPQPDLQPEPVPLFLKPEKYLMPYMLYANWTMYSSEMPIVTLEYDARGNVIKRNGGLLPINPNSGYDGIYSPGVYEEVKYFQNEILITQADTFKNLNVYPNPKRIFLDQQNRIQKTIKETTIYNTSYDTVFYYYTGDKLTSTVYPKYPATLTKHFIYNHAGNLIQTNAIYFNKYLNDTMYTETETFTNYDNAPNPLKRLGIFDELFYRSLSQNNFRSYSFVRIDKYGYIMKSNNRNWQFKYDSSGNIILYE